MLPADSVRKVLLEKTNNAVKAYEYFLIIIGNAFYLVFIVMVSRIPEFKPKIKKTILLIPIWHSRLRRLLKKC